MGRRFGRRSRGAVAQEGRKGITLTCVRRTCTGADQEGCEWSCRGERDVQERIRDMIEIGQKEGPRTQWKKN